MPDNRVTQAQQILEVLGLPAKQCNERSALVFLSLLNLLSTSNWSEAEAKDLRIVDIMDFIRTNYGKDYKPNTRETIRKDTIHQFRDAGLILSNTSNEELPTNSPKYSYRISPEVLYLVHHYGENSWQDKLAGFLASHETLIERYSNKRELQRIPINVDSTVLSFSPGDHNVLQKAIIEEFASRFAQNSEVLYLGDTESKYIIKKDEKLSVLGISLSDHDKLPDIILYKEDTNWIYFIESVTSVGPISQKRLLEIQDLSQKSTCGKIYVTAFQSRDMFKKFFSDLAWETEIWLSDEPEHLIHLNGDRFMGPR